jgi:hypothetical protein
MPYTPRSAKQNVTNRTKHKLVVGGVPPRLARACDPAIRRNYTAHEEVRKMPHRHWFVIQTINGQERRSGPYASRKTAAREASERYRIHTSDADVRLIYELVPPVHTGRS